MNEQDEIQLVEGDETPPEVVAHNDSDGLDNDPDMPDGPEGLPVESYTADHDDRGGLGGCCG